MRTCLVCAAYPQHTGAHYDHWGVTARIAAMRLGSPGGKRWTVLANCYGPEGLPVYVTAYRPDVGNAHSVEGIWLCEMSEEDQAALDGKAIKQQVAATNAGGGSIANSAVEAAPVVLGGARAMVEPNVIADEAPPVSVAADVGASSERATKEQNQRAQYEPEMAAAIESAFETAGEDAVPDEGLEEPEPVISTEEPEVEDGPLQQPSEDAATEAAAEAVEQTESAPAEASVEAEAYREDVRMEDSGAKGYLAWAEGGLGVAVRAADHEGKCPGIETIKAALNGFEPPDEVLVTLTETIGQGKAWLSLSAGPGQQGKLLICTGQLMQKLVDAGVYDEVVLSNGRH